MRRILLLSVLILVGCTGAYRQRSIANNCPNPGAGSPPTACIDAGLIPTPDPVHVKQGQWVHFFFTGGSDELKIECSVLESVEHDHGHAWGRAKNDAPLGRHKYTIIDVTTGKRNDPDVMIDPVQ